VKAFSLFEGTDFELASCHFPLNDKVAHECGFTFHSYCQGMNLCLINLWFLFVSLFLSYLVLDKFCFVFYCVLVWLGIGYFQSLPSCEST
jgi:hypothetical protein